MTAKFFKKTASITLEQLKDNLKNVVGDARPYQEESQFEVLSHFLNNIHSVLLNSPTGSGKTFMALGICKYLQDNYKIKIGWCAMRANLLTQAEKENIEKNFNVEILFISMFDKNPPEDLDLLVVDEAHHDSTTSMNFIHSKVKPKMILGLSATPYRTDKIGLCFQKIVKKANIYDLVRDNYLAQFHHFSLLHYSPQSVVASYVKEAKRWGKTIMFFSTMEECQEAQKLLAEAKFDSEIVYGGSDKEGQISDFISGKINILINMMILTEGFDCDLLETAFVRDTPSNSKGVAVQMGGRAMRKHKTIPFKNIVQSVNTGVPFINMAPAQKVYVQNADKGWDFIGADEKINNIILNNISALQRSAVDFKEDKKFQGAENLLSNLKFLFDKGKAA